MNGLGRKLGIGITGVAIAVALALPAAASAHVERSAYWPDPAPDCSVSPCAGGAIPEARTLASALDEGAIGTTRVVCRPDSLARLEASVARALEDGYDIRPTDHRSFTQAEADDLLAVNRALLQRCAYDEIQPAVMDSGNNDRVVVMPGLYEEPAAASKPTDDPACAPYKTSSDSGNPNALSYAYHHHCPNDASLIAVIGRDVGPGTDPVPAPADRHGIPNVGPCIRCNLQLEGSGVSADDVIVEAGDRSAGNGGPSGKGARKHVGIFADRADGFVLRNLTVRHAREHGIYVVETDGYQLDRFKTYYSGSYGVLTFVEDHGLMQNCDAAGHGDSGVYPGGGAKTGAGRDTRYYPEARVAQEIRFCDSRHNASGYSGTHGNSTWVHHNNFYDNALGFTTDVFTAPGHPGFPQQGTLVENNNFYSNNFNPYVPGADVTPSIPAPVGTGLWIAGGNDNVVRNNRFWDNRRRGVMLFAVPDVLVCGPVVGSTTPVPGCDPFATSTSLRNSFYGNIMGVRPDGSADPNGVDFWWDSFAGNTGNCWYGNEASPGALISNSPPVLPDCLGGEVPDLSVGTGYLPNEAELTACFVGFTTDGYPNGNSTLCDWTKDPEDQARSGARARSLKAFGEFCRAVGSTNRTCAPFAKARGARAARRSSLARRLRGGLKGRARVTTRPLGLYTCADWRRASAPRRKGLVLRLRHWVGGPVVGSRLLGRGSVLPDRWAAELLSSRCGQPRSGAFMLYRLYGNAAGFAGVAPG